MKNKIAKAAKKIVVACVLICILLVGFIMVKRFMNSFKYRIKTENGIQESTFIEVNGIKQYIQIRGEDVNNPVIICIHGGPANPISYIAPYFQEDIEDVATFIQYDQRGCGRTYYENGGSSEPDVEMLLADLDGIVDYARERFGKEKVIIMGHSWGTALGTLYVQEYPDKVEGYIALSQVTNVRENKLSAAKKASETEAIKGTSDEERLCTLMEKWQQVDQFDELSLGELSEMTALAGKYIGCEGEVKGFNMFKIGLYSNDMGIQDMKWFLETASAEKYLSYNKAIMDYFLFSYDIEQLSPKYEMPVYYIAGEGDYVIAQEDAKDYFEKIEAPVKEFILLPNTGHDMFLDNPELFGKTVTEILENIGKQ